VKRCFAEAMAIEQANQILEGKLFFMVPGECETERREKDAKDGAVAATLLQLTSGETYKMPQELLTVGGQQRAGEGASVAAGIVARFRPRFERSVVRLRIGVAGRVSTAGLRDFNDVVGDNRKRIAGLALAGGCSSLLAHAALPSCSATDCQSNPIADEDCVIASGGDSHRILVTPIW
jgi:hypothetical protein